MRSIGQSNEVVRLINSQEKFDELFKLLFHSDKKLIMRSADAIEKITLNDTEYLKKHKKEILQVCQKATDKELKWHLALLVTRLALAGIEVGEVWQLLNNWAKNKNENKIVRVNSLQALFSLQRNNNDFKHDLKVTLSQIERENIPSL